MLHYQQAKISTNKLPATFPFGGCSRQIFLKETIASQFSLASNRRRDSARISTDLSCGRAPHLQYQPGTCSTRLGRRGIEVSGEPPPLSHTGAPRKSISKIKVTQCHQSQGRHCRHRQNRHSLQGRWSRIHQYPRPRECLFAKTAKPPAHGSRRAASPCPQP
jgi:hypothetical protein